MYGLDMGWHGVALGRLFLLSGGNLLDTYTYLCEGRGWHTVNFPNVFGGITCNRCAACICNPKPLTYDSRWGFVGGIGLEQLAGAKSHEGSAYCD
jgi:hypothetical protein